MDLRGVAAAFAPAARPVAGKALRPLALFPAGPLQRGGGRSPHAALKNKPRLVRRQRSHCLCVLTGT